VATIAGKTVLVTGAGRGIGRALAEEAARRGATRVYAGIRRPAEFEGPQIEPLALAVTDP
jgi:NAD(P)-dependent dehydrogenase (short-subunit alcohol dehydrogenase family)